MLDETLIQQIADEAETADWQEHVEAALTGPTVANLAALTTFPKRMEQAQAALSGYNPGRVGTNLRDAASVAHALNGGHIRTAFDALVRRRAAHRKTAESPGLGKNGKPLQPDRWGYQTDVTDALISHVRSGDPARLELAKGIAGMVIALSVDPEDLPDVLAKAGFPDDRTAAELEVAARRLKLDPEEGA